nr:hypothetical protein [Chloroflexota bacterium]
MTQRTDTQPERRSRFAQTQQRGRRLLVLATLIGYPGMYLWFWAWRDSGVAPLLWGPVSFVLLGLTLVCGTILWSWTRNRVALAEQSLDERERQVRDHVYVIGYQIIGVAVTIALAIVGLVAVLGDGRVVLTWEMVGPVLVGAVIY